MLHNMPMIFPTVDDLKQWSRNMVSDFARDDDRNLFDAMRICYECHSTEAEFHAETCSKKASPKRTIRFEESVWSEQALDEVRFSHEIADDAVRERLANSYYDAEKARFRAERIARNEAEPQPTYNSNPGVAKRAWLTMAMERSEPAASITDLMRSPPTAMLSTAEPRRKRIP